jgi:hypothetical protein
MKLIAWTTLLMALAISGAAIFYSVTGMKAIFAAIPVIIISTFVLLELGKLVASVWVHRVFKNPFYPTWIKNSLIGFVLILMFLTSVGIFGLLSKGHSEQTAMSEEQVAQVEIIDANIARQTIRVERWTKDLDRLYKGEDVRVDSLVSNEQEVLDNLYTRINKEKDSLRTQANKEIGFQQTRLDQAARRKSEDTIVANEIFDDDTRSKALEKARRNEISVASRAQKEITKIQKGLAANLASIDSKFDSRIAELSDTIQTLRGQSSAKTEDIDVKIDQLEAKVEDAQTKLVAEREEKFVFESKNRRLEAEMGPIKYIAKFLPGHKDEEKKLMENAVTILIILIVVAFDPFAVALLLASQYTFAEIRGPQPVKKEDDELDELIEGITPENTHQEFPEPTQKKSEQTLEVTEDEAAQLAEQFESLSNANDTLAERLKKAEDDKNKLLDVIEGLSQEEPVKEDEIADKDVEPLPPVGDITIHNINYNKKPTLRVEEGELEVIAPPKVRTFGAKADNVGKVEGEGRADFGSKFPENPSKADMFLRVDVLPNRLFKWNGNKWIEIGRTSTDQYLYNEEYIEHLVNQIEAGDYNIDLLYENEQEQIVEYLKNDRNNK